MPLNIKDEETDRLVRELADLTGTSITAAVREAVVAQLAVARRREQRPQRQLQQIIERGRQRATVDDRSDDDILGYGDHGVA